MSLKHKLSIIAAAMATVFAVVSALAGSTLLGREARLVDVVGLFAGGFGAGAGFTAALVSAKLATRRRLADTSRPGPGEA